MPTLADLFSSAAPEVTTLVEVGPLADASTKRWTDRQGGYATTPSDTPANADYDDRLLDAISITRGIRIDQPELMNREITEISLANDDGGLDSLPTDGLEGYDVRILLGGRDWAYSDFEANEVFNGRVIKVLPGLQTMKLRVLSTADLILDRVVEPRRFWGQFNAVDFSESAVGSTGAFLDENVAAAALSFPSTDFTIEILFSTQAGPDADTARTLAAKTDFASDGWALVLGTGNAWAFTIRNTSGTEIGSSDVMGKLDPCRFYWVTVRFDVSENLAEFFLDGVAIGSHTYVTATGGPDSSTSKMTVSRNSATAFWEGRVACVRLWDDYRTDDEIREYLYRDPVAADEANLIAFLRFVTKAGGAPHYLDETTNNNDFDDGTTAPIHDSSYTARNSVAGRPLPLALGRPYNIEPVLVDGASESSLIWRGSSRGLQWLEVRDRGLDVLGVPNLDQAVHQGFGAIKWSAANAPSGIVTADVDGDAIYPYATTCEATNKYWSAATGADAFYDMAASQDRSFTFWAKAPSAAAVRVALSKKAGTGAGSEGWMIHWTAGNLLSFRLSDGTNQDLLSATLAKSGADDEWHHFAICVNRSGGNSVNMYLDGESVFTGTFSNVAEATDCSVATNFYVGSNNGSGGELGGEIGGITIWDTELTALQVRQNMVVEPDWLGDASIDVHYGFYEGESTKCRELTGNGVDMTSTGSPSWVGGPSPWLPSLIALRELQERLAVPVASIDFASFVNLHDIDTGKRYKVGYWTDTSEPAQTTVTKLLSSIWAWWGVDRNGLVTCGQIADPASGTSVATITEDDLTGDPAPIVPPDVVYRYGLGYNRNWRVLNNSDIADIVAGPALEIPSGIASEEYEQLTTEWRTATREDPSILDSYPLARDLPFVEGYLVDRADAEAEALARLGILQTPWQMFELPLAWQPFELDIGQVITFTWSRFSLSGGVKFLITEITDGTLGRQRVKIWRPLP